MKRNSKILFRVLIGSLLLAILYLFNEEKFYSEFWLQKKVDNYSCIEQLKSIDLSDENLTYKFYDDSGIDIEVSLNRNGYVALSLFKWFKDNPNTKTYIFETDKNEIDSLITEFKNSYTKSEIKDIDDHLGGLYSTLTFKENTMNDAIEIGFYNIVPDKKFKNLKSKIVDIGNKVISEIEE